MSLYDTREESGRMRVRLTSHQLAEQDIANYGACARSDQELEQRARYHVAQMQAQLPTPQTVLADDSEAFTALMMQYYATIYKGLLVAYTGLKEPFRLTVEPRYRTSANFDDSEDEHEFTGLAGLQAIIKQEQARRRQAAKADECSAEAYLLTMVQVTIWDAQESIDAPRRFICYDLVGDEIAGAYAREGVSDEVLRGLGLPVEETNASAWQEEQPCDRWPAVTISGLGVGCDVRLHVTAATEITARHTFTLVFRRGAIAVLHVYGAPDEEEARAFAASVLPNSYEVVDGDTTYGHAEAFHAWTCAQAQEAQWYDSQLHATGTGAIWREPGPCGEVRM